jgi:hypothetical protein
MGETNLRMHRGSGVTALWLAVLIVIATVTVPFQVPMGPGPMSGVAVAGNTGAGNTPTYDGDGGAFVTGYVPEWDSSPVMTAGLQEDHSAVNSSNVTTTVVLDRSYSMTENNSYANTRDTATAFVDGLLAEDRAGLITFNDTSPTLEQNFTSNHTNVTDAIANVSTSASDGGGLAAAINETAAEHADEYDPNVAYLLSDGKDMDGAAALAAAENASTANLTVHTVGFGDINATNHSLLFRVAAATNGSYHYVQNSTEVPTVYDRNAANLKANLLHSEDGDALPDEWEDEGIPTTSQGTAWPLASTNDTDDDGLDDGEELRLEHVNATGGSPAVAVSYEMIADPALEDSDNDGLDDYNETRFGFDPLKTDTNGNGTMDPNEDLDDDGLVVSKELEHETSPYIPDTDQDGLEDGPEVITHGTEPTNNDTDGDGIQDGPEINRLGTDPLDTDTDGDGTTDDAETYSLVVEDSETNVTVNITGTGNVARGLQIDQASTNATDNFRIGHTINLDHSRSFSYANVTIPINDSVNLSTMNTTLYKWNNSQTTGSHPVNTTLDKQNRTLSANLSSFSSLAPANKTKGKQQTSAELSEGWPQFENFTGGSAWTVAGNYEYNSTMRGGNGVLVLDHDTNITEAGTWARAHVDLRNDSLEEAYVEMHLRTHSDGGTAYAYVTNSSPTAYESEDALKETKMKVPYSCGVDDTCYTKDGKVRFNVTEHIGEKVTVKLVNRGDSEVRIDWARLEKHTDSDGISDAVENASSGIQAKVLTNNGLRQEYKPLDMDYNSTDTDGDELPDNYEVSFACCSFTGTNPNRTITLGEYTAHPNKTRTDATGATDGQEIIVNQSSTTTTSSTTSLTTMSSHNGDNTEEAGNPRKPEYVYASYGLTTLSDKKSMWDDGGIITDGDITETEGDPDSVITIPSDISGCGAWFSSASCAVVNIPVRVRFVADDEAVGLMKEHDMEMSYEYYPHNGADRRSGERTAKFDPTDISGDDRFISKQKFTTYKVKMKNPVPAANHVVPMGEFELETHNFANTRQSGTFRQQFAVAFNPHIENLGTFTIATGKTYSKQIELICETRPCDEGTRQDGRNLAWGMVSGTNQSQKALVAASREDGITGFGRQIREMNTEGHKAMSWMDGLYIGPSEYMLVRSDPKEEASD